MYNCAGRAYFVRMEHLRDELLKMLTDAAERDADLIAAHGYRFGELK